RAATALKEVVMAVNVPVPRAPLAPESPTRLERQVAAEHSMVRSVIIGIAVALPFTVAITIGFMAIAMSDKEPCYVCVGLGGAMCRYAATFFGTCAGVMLSSHRFDELDEEASHQPEQPKDIEQAAPAPSA